MIKSVKVLLINPPWYRLQDRTFDAIPLGLCYVTATLKEKGYHKVSVYNADFARKTAAQKNLSYGQSVYNVIAKVKKKETVHEVYKRNLQNPNHPICDTIVNLLTRDLLMKMRNAGLSRVNIGVESGDPEKNNKSNHPHTGRESCQMVLGDENRHSSVLHGRFPVGES